MNSVSRSNSRENVSYLTKEEEDRLLEELEDAENIYLEIGHEEGENFTSLTTFHGMIRIFSSRTWTSLIFWVLVVCTCLVFYMIFSGNILMNYAKATTFQRVSSFYLSKRNERFSICGAQNVTSSQNSLSTTGNMVDSCREYTISTNRNSFQIKISNFSFTSGVFMNIEELHHIPIRQGFSHFMMLEATEVDFPCFAPCREIRHRSKMSYLRNRLNQTLLFVETAVYRRTLEETRKMTMTDVLSLLGGGTSLFLGCSCVTLMETFVFLFKLVVQAISRDVDEVPEDKTHMTTVASETPAPVSILQQNDEIEDNLLRKAAQKRKVSFHPEVQIRFNNSVVDETVKEEIKPPHQPPLSRQASETDKVPQEKPTLGEKLFMKPRPFHRQQAVDVPDDNTRVNTTGGFGLDDFNRAHPARNILRRASTATSRASNTSRARSVKLISQVTPRRRSQIFSKHLVMNDF